MDKNISNNDISIDGFHSPIHKDRIRHGGGVAIYSTDQLAFYERKDLSTEGLELVWSEIHNRNKKFLLGVLYRPPSSLVSHWYLLCSNIDKALEGKLPVFLVGDFNVNMLSNQSSRFKSVLQKQNLTNLVNCPTNFTTTEGTCIDLLITSDPSLVDSTFVTPPFCSTHSVVGLDLTFNIHKHYAYKREITLYNEANYTHLNSELDKINWDNEVFSTTDMDEIYSKSMDVLTTTINKHIPKKVVTIRPRDKVFMNRAIRILMRQRNRIHHKAVRTQNPLHWAKYRLLRNKVIDEIRNSRDNYNKKLTAQINKTIPPGKWWRIVKSLAKLNNKHKPPPPS